MSDVEQLVREALRRHEAEIPLVEQTDVALVSRRTRRRQLLNGIGAIVVAALVAIGVTSGVNSLLRSEAHRPADHPSPPPGETNGLTPPAEAPIAVGAGTTKGWPWLLSASADGTCIAFTDRQGTESECTPAEELSGVEGATDIVDVFVRSPRAPGPSVTFYFGRVPPQAVSVDLNLPTLEATRGRLFARPDGVDVEIGYYVKMLRGYPYPFVPDALVWAYGQDGDSVGAREFKDNGAAPERPDWAQAPTFTTVESIVSGTFKLFGKTPWEIAVFRNDATGKLCLGEVGAVSVCGPQDDPLDTWEDGLAELCDRFPPCAWPPLDVVGGVAGAGFGEFASWGWGIFRAPVATVRIERHDGAGRDGWLDTEVFELPSRYGAKFRIFVYQCDDCLSGGAVGLDAAGKVVRI